MSASVGRYNSTTDFRISSFPPYSVDPDGKLNLQPSVEELYQFAQQVIQTFINRTGIDGQQGSLWGQLAGSSSTLLSGNLNRIYVTASEAILGFNAINLFNNGGVLGVRNAVANTAGRQCDGFLNYIDGVLAGFPCEVLVHSGVAQFTGLVPGSRYYLSNTPGLITPVAPTAAGQIEQYLGVATDATHLAFTTHYWIQH